MGFPRGRLTPHFLSRRACENTRGGSALSGSTLSDLMSRVVLAVGWSQEEAQRAMQAAAMAKVSPSANQNVRPN